MTDSFHLTGALVADKDRSSHTPGPWKVCYDGQIDGADGAFVCAFRWDSFKEFNMGNNAANARLIAASPTLLAACQLFIDTIHSVEQRCMAADGPVTPTCDEITDEELRRVYEACRSAIASATGSDKT